MIYMLGGKNGETRGNLFMKTGDKNARLVFKFIKKFSTQMEDKKAHKNKKAHNIILLSAS